MKAELLYPPRVQSIGLIPPGTSLDRWLREQFSDRVLAKLKCYQCGTEFTLLRYLGAEGQPQLIVGSASKVGLSTPLTPLAVRYYLDQAYKAQCSGAYSAACAMFRSALEHLLHEQGFSDGMLDQKLKTLDGAIKSGTAPVWAKELDTEYLQVMKALGNGAIHTNGGDISKQDVIDGNLVGAIKQVFHALLQVVYELPEKKKQNLADLKAKAAVLGKS
jgi:hypothetical protein